jgi:hypothetical protein
MFIISNSFKSRLVSELIKEDHLQISWSKKRGNVFF